MSTQLIGHATSNCVVFESIRWFMTSTATSTLLSCRLFLLPLPQQYCTIICHWHAAWNTIAQPLHSFLLKHHASSHLTCTQYGNTWWSFIFFCIIYSLDLYSKWCQVYPITFQIRDISRRPLLFKLPTPWLPMTPCHMSWFLPTLALKSPYNIICRLAKSFGGWDTTCNEIDFHIIRWV